MLKLRTATTLTIRVDSIVLARTEEQLMEVNGETLIVRTNLRRVARPQVPAAAARTLRARLKDRLNIHGTLHHLDISPSVQSFALYLLGQGCCVGGCLREM